MVISSNHIFSHFLWRFTHHILVLTSQHANTSSVLTVFLSIFTSHSGIGSSFSPHMLKCALPRWIINNCIPLWWATVQSVGSLFTLVSLPFVLLLLIFCLPLCNAIFFLPVLWIFFSLFHSQGFYLSCFIQIGKVWITMMNTMTEKPKMILINNLNIKKYSKVPLCSHSDKPEDY